ncbi:MAG: aldehyde dehydrogenase family protein [Methanosarcinales archaeon]
MVWIYHKEMLLQKAEPIYENIEVGGVIINDIPTWRVENMPYGGVKESGFGREGIKYAIEEMTEIKLMVINLVKCIHFSNQTIRYQ